MNDKIVLVGHDPAQAVLAGAMKELIQRFAAKVFFEVFDRHRVNLAFREFHRNFRAIPIPRSHLPILKIDVRPSVVQ